MSYSHKISTIGMTMVGYFCACRRLKRYYGVAITALVVFVVYFAYQIYDEKQVLHFQHTAYTAPCVLPELDPFDSKMMEYIWKPNPLVCDNPPVVFVDSNNTLNYNFSALELLREAPENVNCEIYYIKRVMDTDIVFSKPEPWKPPQAINGDHFRIKCKGSNGILFDNTMARIQKKGNNFQKLKEALAEDKYNLILFGIDSLSRSSAVRQLPKTFNYLESLGGYDMKGYMKVGDNSFVNIAPLLAGVFAEEFQNIDYSKDHLDNLPWIWKNFSKHGAATMLAEDFPILGMFNMDRNGFINLPTDHYMRPFWLANYKLQPMHNLRAHVSRALVEKNMLIGKTSALCLVDKPNHVVVMNYIKQFMVTYKEHRKLSFSFLTELSHEFQNLLQLGDDDITDFVKWLSDEGFLNDTVLIMFSDHGLKFGSNQHLFVARMENRMPFLNIVLPESLKRKYPELDKHLRTNRERLASTFDMHATLRDILNGNFKQPGGYEVNGKTRGTSLFNKLPDNRSCADAWIPDEYCACYKSTPVNITNNPLADRIATAVIDHINLILHGYQNCAKLKLNRIYELRKIEQGLKHTRTDRKRNLWIVKTLQAEEREDTHHSIVFETLPGYARFFATCDVIEDSIEVLGNVDRVNKYGNQSHCVSKHELKPVCFCGDHVGH